MRASKLVAAALAVGLVGVGVVNLKAGTDLPPPAQNTTCRNAALSFTDQAQCEQTLKSAANASEREAVVASYRSKIDSIAQDAARASETN